MDDLIQSRDALTQQIAETEAKLAALRAQVHEMDRKIAAGAAVHAAPAQTESVVPPPWASSRWPMAQDEYRRYGRQMIVEEIGLQGQLKLRSASVLIVGAGGLGCPSALYLAGAGVGTIGLVDGDRVDASNLHRQVVHRTRNVGKLKVDSAIEYLRELNPHPRYIAHSQSLTPQEAPATFASYDLILDCTDNPATRYLISDTAVLLGKPLISASALRTDGQLLVLNHPARAPGDPTGGPCYRCVFPRPPPADAVVGCADGGILGPVVGAMGVLQALEAVKLLTGGGAGERQEGETQLPSPTMLIFSAYSRPPFRNVRLRARRPHCAACSAEASVSLDSLKSGSTDYVRFCGSAGGKLTLLRPEDRISAKELARWYMEQPGMSSGIRSQLSSCDDKIGGDTDNQQTPIVIDTREKVHYDIASLPGAINIPISQIQGDLSSSQSLSSSSPLSPPSWLPPVIDPAGSNPLIVVCRQGNDSQTVTKLLHDAGLARGGQRMVADVRGGLTSWRFEVDCAFPDY